MKKIIVIILFSLFLFTPTATNAVSTTVTGTFRCKWIAGTPGNCLVDFDHINCVNTTEGGYVSDVTACTGYTPSSCQTFDRSCIVDPTGTITPPPVPPPYTPPPDHPSTINTGAFSKYADEYNTAIGFKEGFPTTIYGILSLFLPYILSFAGVILLFMLISGGFTMLTAVSDPKAADAGKQRISAALLGFILLFISYWIMQILEIVLGINILGA